jgi:hypothetical protein
MVVPAALESQSAGDAPGAVISVRDGRAAAVIQHVLQVFQECSSSGQKFGSAVVRLGVPAREIRAFGPEHGIGELSA